MSEYHIQLLLVSGEIKHNLPLQLVIFNSIQIVD